MDWKVLKKGITPSKGGFGAEGRGRGMVASQGRRKEAEPERERGPERRKKWAFLSKMSAAQGDTRGGQAFVVGSEDMKTCKE